MSRMPRTDVLKKAAFWSVVSVPGIILFALLLLIAAAALVIYISRDPGAFAIATPLHEIARDVYERQRSIWQAQSHCIVFDELLFYKPKPGKCQFSNLEFSTILTFDARGFRQTAPPIKSHLRPDRGRLIVVGDSQAMGWGVQDEETFASVLAAEHGFEVFNLAVSSYGTARELLRLQNEFDLRNDDIVVIQYNLNDLNENLAFLKSDGLPRRSPSHLGLLEHTPQRYEIFQVAASIAFIVKGRVIEAIQAFFGEVDIRSRERHAETFLAVLAHFHELDRARVVVCEVADFGEPTSFIEDLRLLADGRFTLIAPVLDTTDFFTLDPHLNPIGHRKLARVISSALDSP